MNPEDAEQLEPLLYILGAIPAIFVVWLLLYMFLPKFILKKFFSKKLGYKKEDALKRKRRFFD